ncbi:MAG: fumarate hydratase [bacterium]|nr:fumarate hydratase [bacterium]MDD5354580.1 fumarate hydratase [bacterium]MDD5757381.1 fumarate hydratase [bacterium]
MKKIPVKVITDKIKSAYITSCMIADKELMTLLNKAIKTETNKRARNVLKLILENCRIAGIKKRPICQDTGMAVVFAEIGQQVAIAGGDLEDAINKGIGLACREGYLRASIVEPLSRKNTKNNIPAVIYTKIVPGNTLKLTVIPKGFGSENMGQVKMLRPGAGTEGIIEFVTEAVKNAGANPCPPMIIGVGIGGTLDKAALLAKEALFGIGKSSKDGKLIRNLEQGLLRAVNKLNIGPAGLGGKNTALKVTAKVYPTHIAGLPVAVNIGCWCHRAKTVII